MRAEEARREQVARIMGSWKPVVADIAPIQRGAVSAPIELESVHKEEAEAVRVGNASQHININAATDEPCMKPQAVTRTIISDGFPANSAPSIKAPAISPNTE